LVLGLGAGQLALFAYTTLRRLRYPFSLEWMESGSYDSLARLMEGRPLYDRPSLEFIPFNYTPLYFHASALVARFLGTGFTPLRAVSLLAACGTVVLVYLLVRRAGAGQLAALAAAITFPTTFAITGGYLDAARPDALYVFMLTAGVLALVHAGPRCVPRRMVFRFSLPHQTISVRARAAVRPPVDAVARWACSHLLGFTLTAGWPWPKPDRLAELVQATRSRSRQATSSRSRTSPLRRTSGRWR
jgi:hypothetical protein